ncbi:MAG: hypothetical protein DWH97_11110 [Planctomycetota bacterium]|jgi:hypothetical protein|nr:MAG: hypothetical protein DWH97_11110 [Planctomycetota bacterium]RLS93604.1 MAG: hypothetical protein DWI12_08525 [Planctomycetota bacterium]
MNGFGSGSEDPFRDDSRDDTRRAFSNSAFSNSAFSDRAQRLLVRALLALRGEARVAHDSPLEHERAQRLADRILLEFPRRVLPIGIAALIAVVVIGAMPLLRDALPQTGIIAADDAAVTIVESGLRERTAAMNDGFEAIRSIAVPFSAVPFAAEAPQAKPMGELPADASANAPFKKS